MILSHSFMAELQNIFNKYPAEQMRINLFFLLFKNLFFRIQKLKTTFARDGL